MTFNTINRGLFKRLHRYFYKRSIVEQNRSSVRKELGFYDCPKLDSKQIREIKDYYRTQGYNKINTDWHRLFSHLSGKLNKRYIPEDLFYSVIEPSLNRLDMLSLTDKNMFDILIEDSFHPRTIVKNMNGIFYGSGYKNILQPEDVLIQINKREKIVIKPAFGSYGGNNVSVIDLSQTGSFDMPELSKLLGSYKQDYIIQEFIEQHSTLTKLNPDSVNSIRICSLFLEDKVEVLHALLKIGRKGSTIDNISKGALRSVIDRDGNLSEYAYGKEFKIYDKTDSGILIKSIKIPGFERVKELVKTMHLQLPYFGFISWDIAVDKNETPVLIEYNIVGQGIHHQCLVGPLFGEYTEDVLRKVIQGKRS